MPDRLLENALTTATTTRKGVVQLATDGEVNAAEAVAANDSRLSNARTPTAHGHPSTDVTDFAEAVDDRVGVLVVDSATIDAIYDDAGNTEKLETIYTKAPVMAASTANVNVAAPGATIDGVALTAGDRVLLKDQTAGAENGLYVWNGAAVAMTRSLDADTSAEFPAGAVVYVRGGTANGAKSFIHTTAGAITLGTTALTFAQLGGSGGGGAPTSAPYVTTAADATLSAEVVIPGLAASPDISGAGGAGTSDEYDTTTTGLTWSPSAPATVDSDTTIQSHLYIRVADTTERFGTKAWAPAGAFDARCKVALGMDGDFDHGIGLLINDGTNANRIMLLFQYDPANDRQLVVAYTYAAGAYTQRGVAQIYAGDEVYLRIVRDASNNVSWYWSRNGKLWQFITTVAFTLTVANLGVRTASASTTAFHAAVDWLRTSV